LERNFVLFLEDIRTRVCRLGLFEFDMMTRLPNSYSSGAREFPPKRPHRFWGSRSFLLRW